MAKTIKAIEEKIIAKNYKMVLLETLIQSQTATVSDLTKRIQEEIPFLKMESPFRVRAEFVLPTLKKSKCFVDKGKEEWSLSDAFLHLADYAYQTLKKGGVPLTIDALKENIALENGLHPSDIPLNLEDNERFFTESVGGAEYWFIEEWEFCNEYAFALFAMNQNKALPLDEIENQLVKQFKRKKKGLILMLREDSRFKPGSDGSFNVFPKFLKRLHFKQISRSDMDKICQRLEGEEKSLSLMELSEEYLQVPFPLTNLEQAFQEDLRFQLVGSKVRRSRLSADEIRELKRKDRAKKLAENALAKKKAKEEMQAAKIQPEIAEEIVPGSEMDPEYNEEEAQHFKRLMESVRSSIQGGTEEILPGVRRAVTLVQVQDAPKPVQEPEAQAVPVTSEPEVKQAAVVSAQVETTPQGTVRRREPVLKKSATLQQEVFDVAGTGVNVAELNGFLKELTERDGMAQEMSPERLDDMLVRYLPFKIADYRPTHPSVSAFMVKLARPRLEHLVFDLACGRGDILLKTLNHVRGSLRKDNEQDAEHFRTFCDEQIVGMDVSSFAIRGAGLNLRLSGHEISLLLQGSSLEPSDILIDEMYSIGFADMTNLNPREVKGFLETAHRIFQDGGEGVFVVNSDIMSEDGEVAQFVQEHYFLRHQIVFNDVDGMQKHILHVFKDMDRRDKTKLFRLDNLDQLNRVLDLIH
ncbi:MAG: hypothetical protein H3C47_02255 [Candidatus Cloacimonetes bacterium]|nr:hypothetical protein [Candidatus Cloacimonadota bacterium]